MAAAEDDDDKMPLVIDHGTYTMQAGFAGDDAPRTVFRSLVGRPRHRGMGELEDLKSKYNMRDTYVGDEAQLKRGILTLSYPIEHGVVTRWDDMEAVWSHIFSELKFDPKEERSVLSQTPNNPKEKKEKTAEIFFEKFQSPGIFLANQAELALFSSGKTCGLIVDSGHGLTYTMAIHPNIPDPPAARQMELAGRDLDEEVFRHLLIEHGFTGRFSDIVRMKEKLCYVSLDPDNESSTDASGQSSDQNTFELPNGESITMDSDQRYKIPEALFKPATIKREELGIHEMAYNCLSGLEDDVRKDLLRTVYCVGGLTLLPGFKERLQRELIALAPPSLKVFVNGPPERKYSVWIGGSILGAIRPSASHWITKEEYEEKGPDVVERK